MIHYTAKRHEKIQPRMRKCKRCEKIFYTRAKTSKPVCIKCNKNTNTRKSYLSAEVVKLGNNSGHKRTKKTMGKINKI